MKTIYTMMLTALVMLGLSFQAKADTYSSTVEWNISGAATVTVGLGTNAQTPEINADGTSCSFSYDNYTSAPYVYVVPSDATKYYIKAAYYTPAGGTETQITGYFVNASKASIKPEQYNGNKVRIEFAEIVYDSEFTIKVVNGRDKFNEMFPKLNSSAGSTNLTLKTGENKIKFASGYHTDVTVRAASYQQDASPYYHENAYVKINGEPGTLTTTKYMTTFLNNQAINDGDVFEICYWDQADEGDDDEDQGPYTVTINADELGAKSINMIFNKTQRTSISARDQFEVNANDIFTISCNTYDYTVTVNGERLADNPSIIEKYTVWTSPAITENYTVNITAVDRVYDTSDVAVAVTNPDGINLHPGYQDADPVNLSDYTATEITFKGTKYMKYVIPVTQKSCKVFASVKDGYWLKSSLDSEGEEAYIATPEQIMYIDNPKLEATARIGVYVECGEDLNGFKGSLSNVGLYNSSTSSDRYELQEGMNYIDLDVDYVNGPNQDGMRIRPFDIHFEDDAELGIKANTFMVYQNFSTLSRDDNDVFHAVVKDKDIIRVYIGNPATIYTVPVELGPNSDLQVTLDALQPVNMKEALENGSFQAFYGQSATVTSESSRAYCVGSAIDDEDAEVKDGTNSTFTFGRNAKALFEPRADIKLHADDNKVDDMTSVTVSFPGAKSAKRVQEIDEMYVRKSDWNWSPIKTEIEEVAGAENPTFKFVFTPADAPFGTYTILIPEGFFVVTNQDNTTEDNAELFTNFDYSGAVSQEDLAISLDPAGDYVLNNESVTVTAIINEKYSFPREINKEKVTAKFKGETVSEYECNSEDNYLMFSFKLEGEGELELTLAEGVATIAGTETPAASKKWNVVLPKEYKYELTPSLDGAVKSLSELTLSFPEAKTAERFNEYSGISLKSNDYTYTNYNPSVEAVEGAAVPTFKITFDPAPTADGDYQLTIMQETFQLDGCQYNQLIDKNFTIDSSLSGIGNIVMGNEGTVTVVSVDGRVVLKNASASEISKLENGVYIVNGKKVVL